MPFHSGFYQPVRLVDLVCCWPVVQPGKSPTMWSTSNSLQASSTTAVTASGTADAARACDGHTARCLQRVASGLRCWTSFARLYYRLAAESLYVLSRDSLGDCKKDMSCLKD